MELVGEDGRVLELKEGHPLVLGRGAGLSQYDGSVSRHQIVVELLRPSSRKGKEVVGQSLGLKLQVQVVGRNPICVVNRGREEKSNAQVKFLCNGQKDWLIAGDKISLSIKRPFFYELRYEGRSSPTSEEPALFRKTSSNGVESARGRTDGNHGKFAIMDEEEGIAEAVARRQRRKSERERSTGNTNYCQQRQTLNVGWSGIKPEISENDETKVASHKEENGQISSRKVENGEQAVKKEEEAIQLQGKREGHSIDPVAEFGFIVEGSEFSSYEKRSKALKSVWRPEIGESKEIEDDFSGDEQMTSGRGINKDTTVARKSHTSDDEEEWGGDNKTEQDRLKIVGQRKGQKRIATRRSGLKSTTRKTDDSEGPSVKPSKRIREDSDEGSDDSAGSLDDFIVDDEDPIEDDEEDEHDVGASRKGGGKSAGQSQKPECIYGSKCYRKNAEHRAQFYHPSS